MSGEKREGEEKRELVNEERRGKPFMITAETMSLQTQ